MKKFLLSLIGLAALTASAANYQTSTGQSVSSKFNSAQTIEFPTDVRNMKAAQASASNSVDYTLHNGPYQALGFQNAMAGNKVAMAFEMTPETTTEYAGNKITHINFWTGANSSTGTNMIPEVTVFLSEGDHTTAFYTQTSPVGTGRFTYYSVELDEPYTIEAGKDLYIGCYSILTSSADLTVVVDGAAHSSVEGGWCSSSATAASPFDWFNVTDQVGYLCVGATMQADNFPQNKAAIVSASAPEYVAANTPFEVKANVTNKGLQPLRSVEVEYTVNNSEPKTATGTFYNPIATLKSGECVIPGVTVPSTGAYNIVVKLTKVNGVAIEDAGEASALVMSMAEGMGFTPNVVIEEFTGTWCGYCPLGYTTMEEIHEKYTDGTLIPVCIHADDAMESDTYIKVNDLYNNAGFPNSIINRNAAYENNQGALYPYPLSDIEVFYNQIRANLVPAGVTLQCKFTEDNKSVVFEGNTQFCLDFPTHNYTLSFGLTEDNVGPYTQNNNYYRQGAQYGEWNEAGSRVSLKFNDVGRKLDNINGIEGLIPATLTAGKDYPYTYTMTIPSGVKNENLNGIVYLTNKTTGFIVNAATVKAGKFGTAGVNDVLDDDVNAPVEYFNLQGIKVENPSNGIFIRRQGTKTTKVAIN